MPFDVFGAEWIKIVAIRDRGLLRDKLHKPLRCVAPEAMPKLLGDKLQTWLPEIKSTIRRVTWLAVARATNSSRDKLHRKLVVQHQLNSYLE